MTSATGASAAGSRAGGVRLHGRLVADGADLADGVVVVQEGRVAFAGPAGALPAELTDVPTPDGWRRDLVLMPGGATPEAMPPEEPPEPPAASP